MTAEQSILRAVADYLAYQREEGRAAVSVSPETLALLKTRRTRRAGGPDARAIAAARAELAAVSDEVAACTRCELHRKRTRTVPGQGHPRPEITFVGEGPGADEDRQGLAFVGKAGQLLTRMIEAMGFTRDEVFIANVVKCRPPANRNPLPEETEACLPYLRRQLAILRPKVVITLGAVAAHVLLETTQGISRLRGRWSSFEGIDLMPTFHPAYLLRTPSAKHATWEDLQAVLARLGRKPPERKKERG